jgi:hypothetical protein
VFGLPDPVIEELGIQLLTDKPKAGSRLAQGSRILGILKKGSQFLMDVIGQSLFFGESILFDYFR